MKTLIFVVILSCYSMVHYAPMAIKQFNDYKKSSACIKEEIRDGYAMGNIKPIGDSCKVRVE